MLEDALKSFHPLADAAIRRLRSKAAGQAADPCGKTAVVSDFEFRASNLLLGLGVCLDLRETTFPKCQCRHGLRRGKSSHRVFDVRRLLKRSNRHTGR